MSEIKPYYFPGETVEVAIEITDPDVDSVTIQGYEPGATESAFDVTIGRDEEDFVFDVAAMDPDYTPLTFVLSDDARIKTLGEKVKEALNEAIDRTKVDATFALDFGNDRITLTANGKGGGGVGAGGSAGTGASVDATADLKLFWAAPMFPLSCFYQEKSETNLYASPEDEDDELPGGEAEAPLSDEEASSFVPNDPADETPPPAEAPASEEPAEEQAPDEADLEAAIEAEAQAGAPTPAAETPDEEEAPDGLEDEDEDDDDDDDAKDKTKKTKEEDKLKELKQFARDPVAIGIFLRFCLRFGYHSIDAMRVLAQYVEGRQARIADGIEDASDLWAEGQEAIEFAWLINVFTLFAIKDTLSDIAREHPRWVAKLLNTLQFQFQADALLGVSANAWATVDASVNLQGKVQIPLSTLLFPVIDVLTSSCPPAAAPAPEAEAEPPAAPAEPETPETPDVEIGLPEPPATGAGDPDALPDAVHTGGTEAPLDGDRPGTGGAPEPPATPEAPEPAPEEPGTTPPPPAKTEPPEPTVDLGDLLEPYIKAVVKDTVAVKVGAFPFAFELESRGNLADATFRILPESCLRDRLRSVGKELNRLACGYIEAKRAQLPPDDRYRGLVTLRMLLDFLDQEVKAILIKNDVEEASALAVDALGPDGYVLGRLMGEAATFAGGLPMGPEALRLLDLLAGRLSEEARVRAVLLPTGQWVGAEEAGTSTLLYLHAGDPEKDALVASYADAELTMPRAPQRVEELLGFEVDLPAAPATIGWNTFHDPESGASTTGLVAGFSDPAQAAATAAGPLAAGAPDEVWDPPVTDPPLHYAWVEVGLSDDLAAQGVGLPELTLEGSVLKLLFRRLAPDALSPSQVRFLSGAREVLRRSVWRVFLIEAEHPALRLALEAILGSNQPATEQPLDDPADDSWVGASEPASASSTAETVDVDGTPRRRWTPRKERRPRRPELRGKEQRPVAGRSQAGQRDVQAQLEVLGDLVRKIAGRSGSPSKGSPRKGPPSKGNDAPRGGR